MVKPFRSRRSLLFKLISIAFFFFIFLLRLVNLNWEQEQQPQVESIILVGHNADNITNLGINPIIFLNAGNLNDRKYSGETINPVSEIYEKSIKEDEDRIIPNLGDYGVPVIEIPGVDENEVNECIKQEAFNRLLSDRMSYVRKVPDARNPLCENVQYDLELPTASVVVIFNNEAWSTLIRTIYSILTRSPEQFLEEIVLIDDKSDKEELNGKLDYYIKTRLPKKVKLHRLKKRSGLIRARLTGAKIAKGDILVFLDSHCEVGIDWLEPLLLRIKEKREAVIMPIIDVIDDKNMAYLYNNNYFFQIGGFTWSGHFTWINIPPEELKRRKSDIEPTRSPTMAGGLLAIDRSFFWEIGSYDIQMDIWGGENLEMSFRIWQCGGSLEIAPCSRVGHIFRSFHPYSFPGNKDTHGINTARMAEVWMDSYKRLFYLHKTDLKGKNIGDVTERIMLRDVLQCHDFKWYLDNIYPQKFVLDENVQAYGRVKSKVKNYCLDTLQKPEDTQFILGLYQCHDNLYSPQYFSLSNVGELRREEVCAEVSMYRSKSLNGVTIRGNVTMYQCNGSYKQKWSYNTKGQIVNEKTKLCLSWCNENFGEAVTVIDCRDDFLMYTEWIWEMVKEPETNVYIRNIDESQ